MNNALDTTYQGFVWASTAQLHRNLANKNRQLDEIENIISHLYSDWEVLDMEHFSANERKVLLESHMTPPGYWYPTVQKAWLAPSKDLILWSDAMDDLVMHHVASGYQINEMVAKMEELFLVAEEALGFYRTEEGYVTLEKELLGTGLRMQVMIQMSATPSDMMDKFVEYARKNGYILERYLGKNAQPLCELYMLTSLVTRGNLHEELKRFHDFVTWMVETETVWRDKVHLYNHAHLLDIAWEAYHQLTSGEPISYESFLIELLRLQLGVDSGLLMTSYDYILNSLWIEMKPYHLTSWMDQGHEVMGIDTARGIILKRRIEEEGGLVWK